MMNANLDKKVLLESDNDILSLDTILKKNEEYKNNL